MGRSSQTPRGGRSGGGRGSGSGYRNRNSGGANSAPAPRRSKQKELDSERAVPMLTFGTDSNFAIFREKLLIACLEKYGNLAMFIELKSYYVPPVIDKDDHYTTSTTDADLRDSYKTSFLTAMKGRQIEIEKMKAQRANIYAYITSKLSDASDDEVKRHPDYSVFSKTFDALALWSAIEEKHLVTTTSTDARVIRNKASTEYANCKQGPFVTLFEHRSIFDLKYKAYVSQGNKKKDDEDVAMDFLQSLDNSRYSGFKVSFMNGISMGSIQAPKSLNDVYNKANQRVELRGTPGRGAEPPSGL